MIKPTVGSNMIKPTVGRVVWYVPGNWDKEIMQVQVCAAIITYVWSDTKVNLAVFDGNGVTYGRHDVLLIQEGDERPKDGRFCEWMPYQKGQAAKTEELEKQVAGAAA